MIATARDAGADRICFADSVGILLPDETFDVLSLLRHEFPDVVFELSLIHIFTCEITVAQAEPFMPHPKPKINNGFKAQLITTDANVAYIAIFGNPEERKTAFKPKYICVTTFPYNIIRI